MMRVAGGRKVNHKGTKGTKRQRRLGEGRAVSIGVFHMSKILRIGAEK
jgi:hypothetical protein